VPVISEQQEIERIYTLYKPSLFALAYRMLGSVMDAEDIVQESFLSIHKSGADHIQNMKAYLCKIVINRCLEWLRSTKKQREVYVGAWLPEPLVTAGDEMDPMHAYVQKESISTAYLLLLQQLSYVERAVFLLREAMQYDYDAIAEIVGKSSTNCRQIFHRAKRSLGVTKQEPDRADPSERKLTAGFVEQFMRALASGDAAQIMKFLSADAVLVTDGGGQVQAIPQPVHGHVRISNLMAEFIKKFSHTYTYDVATVNGQPGVVVYLNGKVHSVLSFQALGDLIDRLFIVANPGKLRHVHS
jgi:RNA polymerase sigma-70 factor (ECF subfamily)